MKKMLMAVADSFAFIKPLLEAVSKFECTVSSWWVAGAHRRLMLVQWGMSPLPEHFDHQIDLYQQWLKTRNPLWVERGVFSSLALQGKDVLELSCGDGFNARNFYSLNSRRVVACDFDPKAISTALRKNQAENVEFVLADIRSEMPEGRFENIVWDAAIEHFTEEEIDKILNDITTRLVNGGVLSGYTIVEDPVAGKAHHEHEYEFKGKDDLLRFLTPHFKYVTVFETRYPTRHNLYFWASDGVLPFRDEWPDMITEKDGK